MAITDALNYLKDTVGAIDGIRGKSTYPKESLNAFPELVIYAQGGTYEISPPGVKKGLHNLVVEIHVARMDLSRDIEKLTKFFDTVPTQILKDPTLGGTVSTVNTIRYDLISTEYGGQQTIMYRWTMENVKIMTELGA